MISYSTTVIGSALLLAGASGQAADWAQNLYLNADAGAIFQQDADFHQTGLPTLNATFNPGIRTDLAIGYKLTDSFALELEPGFTWNSIDELGGSSLDRFGQSVDLYSVPIMFNAVYTFPTLAGWTPYVGLGLGPDVGFFQGSLPWADVNDTDVTLGYQAQAGVRYALTEHSSVGLGYKFLGTTDQDYDLNMGGGYVDHVKLSGVYIHGVFASFNWTF